MTKLNLQLKGSDKLIKKLSAISKEAEEDVINETFDSASQIESMAKQLAPVNKNPKITGGSLRQSITKQKLNPLTWRIYTPIKYAPYVEFGTGGLVQVPAELKDLAIRFKGKGIRKVNMLPQPYMYPAWKSESLKYVNKLKKLLKKYGQNLS